MSFQWAKLARDKDTTDLQVGISISRGRTNRVIATLKMASIHLLTSSNKRVPIGYAHRERTKVNERHTGAATVASGERCHNAPIGMHECCPHCICSTIIDHRLKILDCKEIRCPAFHVFLLFPSIAIHRFTCVI